MKRTSKMFIKVGLISIAVGILVTVVGIASGAKSRVYFDYDGIHISDGYDDESVVVREMHDMDTINRIYIDVEFGNIQIIEGNSFGYEINSSDTYLSTSFTNGTLEIINKEKMSMRVFNFDFSWIHNLTSARDNRYTYIVYIPVGHTVEIIDVNAAMGDITIDSITASKVDLDANLGDIDVYKSNITDLNIDVDLGTTNINNTIAGTTNVAVNLGDIKAYGTFNAATSFKVDLGDIKFETSLPRNHYNLKSDIDLGSIKINDEKNNGGYDNNSSGVLLDIQINVGDGKLYFNK